ncbi:MAG TPA: hypothetical protein PKW55_03920 [Spirochaetota bacterium]|nr:hypothetical protein [Spirochaetota bacterium]HOM38018.1 hypothetical protein [Spirochaetota bacterium]HPQ48822.1 hypothetical protein [Spirochaetota bacterium]
MKSDVFVLGATGSIGYSSLKSIKKTNSKLIGFSFNKNLDRAIEIIREYNPEYILTFDNVSYNKIKNSFKNLFYGEDGLREIISKLNKNTKFINGIYGTDGIKSSFIIAESGFDLLLANKESLVMGGDVFTKKFTSSKLLPIDSEHWALFNILRFIDKSHIKTFYLTASGGIVFKCNKDFKTLTIDDLKKHPVWDMGIEITVNSSTMANKGLELIEAKELFNIDPNNIIVVIHPEAFVHSMVKLKSGAIIPYISNPDMCEPITGALLYPEYYEDYFGIENKTFNFYSVDFKKYPMLELAYEVSKKGLAYHICYTVSNEFFVREFIERRICFTDIYKNVYSTLSKFKPDRVVSNIDDIFYLIDYSKDIVYKFLKKV